MKSNFLLMLFVISILCSCKKDNNVSFLWPETPEDVYYDFNGDELDDILIGYRKGSWDGVNSSGYVVLGIIELLEENSILLKRNTLTLFNKLNDTIRRNPYEPDYWTEEEHIIDLVKISTVDELLWPKEWKIHTNLTSDFFYSGIRINNENHNQIGWIKIMIDKSTGDIQIIDKEFTAGEFIVINR